MSRAVTRQFAMASALTTLCASAGADLPSTAESVAIHDATIALCSRQDPKNAALYEKLREPPYACAALDPQVIVESRRRDDYAVARRTFDDRMSRVSAAQIGDFCRTQLEARCGP